MHAKSLQLCLTLCDPWTLTCQDTLSLGFSSKEYWSGLLCSPPGDLPDPEMEPMFPAWTGGFLPLAQPGKP